MKAASRNIPVVPILLAFMLAHAGAKAAPRALIRSYQDDARMNNEAISGEGLREYFIAQGKEDEIPISFSNTAVLAKAEGVPSIYNDPHFIIAQDKLAAEEPTGRVYSHEARRVTRSDVERNYEYETSVAVAQSFGRYSGGGVLIEGGYVLTAGHLWDGEAENYPERVWMGLITDDNDFRKSSSGSVLKVARYIRHSGYREKRLAGGNPVPLANDIMLLELDHLSKARVRVHAKLLQRSHASKIGVEPWNTVRVVGYGATQLKQLGNQYVPWGRGVAHTASLLVAPVSPLKYGLNKERFDGEMVSTEFAAPTVLDLVVADTCEGDSGSPVFVAEGGELIVAGLVSRRIPGPGPKCGTGGVYTNVCYYGGWIKDMIANKSNWEVTPQ